MSKANSAIIGAGIGGIATAIRLAAKGYQVHVFEQSDMPGGKISEIREQGFRFDTGPSLFTLPVLVDELFELCGEDPRDYFRYQRLDSSCKYFWDDGMRVTAWSESERFALEMEAQTGVKASKVKAFLDKSRRLYDLTSGVFIFSSFHKIRNFFTRAYLKVLRRVFELDALKTMHQRNTQWFGNPRVVQLFDRYATYNGSSPYLAPATLNVIAHLEHNMGAFFPERGMYQIIDELVALAKRKGVKFFYHHAVQRVMVQDKQVLGLVVNGEKRYYDSVVSNVDVGLFYQHLLPGAKAPRFSKRVQRSSSALIFYWGINRAFPELDLHNILFSTDYRKEFEHLFRYRTIAPDPTVYVFISSKVVGGDAPAGMENWYVMINVPENIGQYNDRMIEKARQQIIGKINQVLQTDIEKHILFEKQNDPRSIESRTGSPGGSLYGPSSNDPLAAFSRHPNFRSRYRNLYFCGGSVHPGGGIPLCLASARIVSREA